MRKIKIKINVLGVKNEAQAIIRICNKGNLVIEKNTYNGEVVLLLKEDELYNLNICSRQGSRSINFYVDKKRKVYVFNLFIWRRIITFQLMDANYNNLPIEKGEIVLWQK